MTLRNAVGFQHLEAEPKRWKDLSTYMLCLVKSSTGN